MSFPVSESSFDAIKTSHVDQISENVAEVCIAGHAYCGSDTISIGVIVTSYAAPYRIAPMTSVTSARGNDALLQSDQCIYNLEGRARRIESHDSAIEEGFVLAGIQSFEMFGAYASDEQIGVVGGR